MTILKSANEKEKREYFTVIIIMFLLSGLESVFLRGQNGSDRIRFYTTKTIILEK